jgi:ABC-type transport system substrate-binding protein
MVFARKDPTPGRSTDPPGAFGQVRWAILTRRTDCQAPLSSSSHHSGGTVVSYLIGGSEMAFRRRGPIPTTATLSILSVLAVTLAACGSGSGSTGGDGKTYTIHLRTGVKWNTTPARDVTAQDEILGLKRLCSPVGAPGYYETRSSG